MLSFSSWHEIRGVIAINQLAMNERNRNSEEGKQENNQPSKRYEENPSKKEEGTPIYLTSDSTLQTPSEHEHDKSVDPTKNTRMEASDDDLHDIKAGKMTGRDEKNSEDV